MPWRSAETQQWAMIGLGLTVGGLARWALLIRDRVKVTLGIVLTDLMMMGVLALAAKWTVGRLGLTGETTAMVAVLFALSSDRIVRLMLTWFHKSAARAAADAGVAIMKRPITDEEPEMNRLVDEIDRKTS